MILVFGKSGQVATELASLGDVSCLGRDVCDLSKPGAAHEMIANHVPDVVINAAAYTAVDLAEQEEALATQINGHAVAEMAHACAERQIPLIHISTDYVFPGKGNAPHVPGASAGPINAYGRSKLIGEEAVRNSRAPYAILRTSWVFSAHGNNFLKTMLQLGDHRDVLTIISDQVGGPTTASAIAAACLQIADQLQNDPSKSGTYHFTGTPDVSWADFARTIFDYAKITCKVIDIHSADYPTAAPRPLNSCLDCTTTSQTFHIPRHDWRQGLVDTLKELHYDT